MSYRGNELRPNMSYAGDELHRGLLPRQREQALNGAGEAFWKAEEVHAAFSVVEAQPIGINDAVSFHFKIAKAGVMRVAALDEQNWLVPPNRFAAAAKH